MTPMLAKNFQNNNPAGWWMSEKLDGVRAVWNGRDFVSRNGNVFPAPEWCKQGMPETPLDGELYMGRGKFQQTAGEVRKKAGDWEGIRYMVFDVISDKPFEQRQKCLKGLALPGFCAVVEQVPCSGKDHLKMFAGNIQQQGGEGVILRQPGSLYKEGRSESMVKLKRVQTDEAEVIGYRSASYGRNSETLAALVCRYRGNVFSVSAGLSDVERISPPAVGDVITFSFFELTSAGKPRFPVYIAIRNYE